jgi:hypothetical protein
VETRHLQNGIDLYFSSEDGETADIIEVACRRSVSIIAETWGLTPPKRCRVFIMTTWYQFIFQSAPWYLWVPYFLLFPMLFLRWRKLWRFAGGLTLRYRNNPAVGIKPPRLLALCDASIGEKIFIKEPDLNKKTEHLLCHELTHAFSASLMLPMWLNEGLAMLSVDRYFGRETVRPDSLLSLSNRIHRTKMRDYRALSKMSKETVVYHYVRGYWLTRFLLDTHPELLRELLKKKHTHRTIERKIAVTLGMPHSFFRKMIDEEIVAHFGKMPAAGESETEANEGI